MAVTTLDKLNAQVGFIGLGLMGSRLTRRLHSGGWNIRAWNRSPQAAVEINKQGVGIAASVADLVADSDVILSSLANRGIYLTPPTPRYSVFGHGRGLSEDVAGVGATLLRRRSLC
jgi:glutamyl-tRNA reductase